MIQPLFNIKGHPRFQGKKSKTTPVLEGQEPFPLDPNVKGLDRFVFFADGGLNNDVLQDLVRQMEDQYAQGPYGTILRGGDNVYGPGLPHRTNPLDGDPSLFEDRLTKPFKALEEKPVQIFTIMGNHDVRWEHEEAQLAYLGLPRYYSFQRGNIGFFALDTTVYLPGYDKCYKNREEKAHQIGQAQSNWLDRALQASIAKYKVVMGHYPLYNSGKYFKRGENAGTLRQILEPILVDNKVDIYLCGHEHHYERSAPIYGIHHFISGSASLLTDKIYHKTHPPYPRKKLLRKHQFMIFQEKFNGLAFDVIDRVGKVLDKGLVPLKKRKRAER